MVMISTTTHEELIHALLSGKMGKQYEGKHVVVMGGKAEILPTDKNARAELLRRLRAAYPDEIPEFVFVPRPEMYILYGAHDPWCGWSRINLSLSGIDHSDWRYDARHSCRIFRTR